MKMVNLNTKDLRVIARTTTRSVMTLMSRKTITTAATSRTQHVNHSLRLHENSHSMANEAMLESQPFREEVLVPALTTAGWLNVTADIEEPEPQRDYASDIDSLYRHTAAPHTCKVIGAPMMYGQPHTGTDHGPTLLRQAGLHKSLSALGWRVQDGPDLDFGQPTRMNNNRQFFPANDTKETTTSFNGYAKNIELVGQCNEQLAHTVCTTLSNGRFPLILGGDHSIGMGSLAGVLRARPNTGVLWIDAHADLNTPFTTESGNVHGMPVGMLMDGVAPSFIADGSVPGCNWLRHVPKLHPKSIAYVGLRDVDQAERKFIRSLGIFAMTMHEVDRYGIGRVMEMAMEHLLCNDRHRPLHLSYDIDAIDPMLAPATGTKVRGGLTYREGTFVAEVVAQSGNLASAEIVELNPTLSSSDGAQETVDLGLELITTLMGERII